jgi:hypothetical protein
MLDNGPVGANHSHGGGCCSQFSLSENSFGRDRRPQINAYSSPENNTSIIHIENHSSTIKKLFISTQESISDIYCMHNTTIQLL